MSIYNLGRVLPIFTGEYDNNKTYNNLDVVLYNGSSYVALNQTQGNLPTDTNHWAIVALACTLSPEQVEYIQNQVIQYVQGQGYVIDSDYVHTDNNFTDADKAKLDEIQPGSGGTSDYTQLSNLPSINGTTLTGNVNLPTMSDLNSKQDTLVSGTNIATINGNNLLEGGNIEIQGGGTSDYTQLSNKPKINNVELSGNKTTSELGINIPTKTSDLTNDSGFINAETEPAFNSSPAKNITNEDITSWNGKQELLVSGTNIATINNQSLLNGGNINIEGGGSSDAVLYTAQSLTNSEQQQARENINALTATTTSETTPDISFNSYNVVVLDDISEMPDTPSVNTIYMIKEGV